MPVYCACEDENINAESVASGIVAVSNMVLRQIDANSVNDGRSERL